MLGLFAVMIVTGLFYLGADKVKQSVCESSEASAYAWEGGKCLNESGGTEVTITAITKMNTLESFAGVIISMVGLLILILLFAIVIRVAKSFYAGGSGY